MRVLVGVVVLLAACGDSSSSGACKDGETRACYAGTADTRGIGACSDGIETCSAGVWQGVCVGDKTPFVEDCNGIDDDCNGVVDDVVELGDTCKGSNGCTGHKACTGDKLGCVADPQNECGVCDGPTIEGLGNDCVANECPGSLVCTSDGTGSMCDAPVQNACGLCGGPTVNNLGNNCMLSNCIGQLACNSGGTASICDCSVGLCNDNGTVRPVHNPDVGELVITELMPKPSAVGATVGQWVEVKALVDLDLNGLSIDRANDTANPTLIQSQNCIHMAANSYAVFARSTDSSMNGGITAVFALPFSINPTSNADFQVLNGTTVIDAVTWTTSSSGKSRSLDPLFTSAVANDDQVNWCDGITAYNTTGGTDRGTPGAANESCPQVAPAGMCYEGPTLRSIVKPSGTALVINEYLANPAGTTSGVDAAQEWFEVTNTGAASFDLNDLTVQGATATTSKIQSTNCIVVPKDGFAVVAHQTDSTLNGGLPKVDATFSSSISLGNTGGTLKVLDGATVLDTITWSGGSGGPDGIALQLDPTKRDATSNDAPPANYCPGLTTYGSAANKGTPGATNVCN